MLFWGKKQLIRFVSLSRTLKQSVYKRTLLFIKTTAEVYAFSMRTHFSFLCSEGTHVEAVCTVDMVHCYLYKEPELREIYLLFVDRKDYLKLLCCWNRASYL